jgi:hypothetical protein
MAGDQPIMLHQMSIAKLFGHSGHRNISNWIKALKTLEMLQPAEAAIRGLSAARYFYVDQLMPPHPTTSATPPGETKSREALGFDV